LAMMANDQTKSQADRDAYAGEYNSLYKFIDEGRQKDWNGRNLFTGETLQVSTGSESTDVTTLDGIDLNHDLNDNTIATATDATDGLDKVKWPPLNDDSTEVGSTDANLLKFYEIIRPAYEYTGPDPGVLADHQTASNYTKKTTPYHDISTITGARAVIERLDAALSAVAERRAKVGALQSALEGKSEFIDIAVENYEATRSRVNDVDIAEESTKMAKYNILMQSSTAILAQANQINANVLRLLS